MGLILLLMQLLIFAPDLYRIVQDILDVIKALPIRGDRVAYRRRLEIMTRYHYQHRKGGKIPVTDDFKSLYDEIQEKIRRG